jgi:hypothetical protein
VRSLLARSVCRFGGISFIFLKVGRREEGDIWARSREWVGVEFSGCGSSLFGCFLVGVQRCLPLATFPSVWHGSTRLRLLFCFCFFAMEMGASCG